MVQMPGEEATRSNDDHRELALQLGHGTRSVQDNTRSNRLDDGHDEIDPKDEDLFSIPNYVNLTQSNDASWLKDEATNHGDGDGDDESPQDIFFIPNKHTSVTSLERWRKATLVLNVAQRFRYTADLAKLRRDRNLKKLQATVNVLRALNNFRRMAKSPKQEMNAATLASLVQDHNVENLKQLGGVEAVIEFTKTSPENGVPDDLQELESRRKMFGANMYPMRAPKRFRSFRLDVDKHLSAVLDSMTSNILTNGIDYGWWYDPAKIGFIVLLTIMFKFIIYYWQSRKFEALNDEKRNIQVEVVRSGRRKEVSIFDIVVGDIVILNIGDRVPADGLLVEGHSLYIDQSSLTGDSEPIHVRPKFPYLLSGSKVGDGSATMVVTSVGMTTKWGQRMAAIGDDTNEETPLQVRLNGAPRVIRKVRVSVAAIMFVALLIFYFMGWTEGSGNSGKFKAGQTSAMTSFGSVVEIFCIVVTNILVAMPEGLPLVVTLTLAYAMKQMIADKALVRRLSACETMGSITTICSDKTGTLTLNQMSVVKAWVGGGMRDPVMHEETLHKEYYDLLYEGIAHNSNGSVFVPAEGGETEVTGSPTEKAALMWGLGMGMDFSFAKSLSTTLQLEAFNSLKKKAGVAVRVTGTGKVHVHWKGAAEIILSHSDKILCPDNSTLAITTEEKIHLMNVIEGMAAESLRCLAFGYMELSDPAQIHAAPEWKIPEGPLTLLAIIGIKDPCRPEVPEAVRRCQAAGIKVRMITGDNIMTAKAIATECGILKEGDVAVDGVTFRNYSDEERKREVTRITVMARSSPTDKLLMVRTLRDLGEVVGVTGDGVNDAPALREADIGLSMGIQGTQVAKESSDIIIMDDNFVSVVKVVRWGRSVYLNIQKFIQFELTVNVAALTINFIAAMSAGDVPLTAVQLLWVNLIMDTLGALVLATERPTDALLERPPIKVVDPLISNVMWRNILSQSCYQVIVLLVLQFRGEELLGLKGHKDADKINKTVMFNAFVFCQLFNEVNARKLEEKNVFKGIFTSWLFAGIVGISIVFQVIIVQFLNNFASTVGLDLKYWLISVLMGSVSWPLAFVIKFIPVPKKPILVIKTRRLKKKKKLQTQEIEGQNIEKSLEKGSTGKSL